MNEYHFMAEEIKPERNQAIHLVHTNNNWRLESLPNWFWWPYFIILSHSFIWDSGACQTES